ncbi:hypothetical protein [Nocardioides sp. AN3]
MALNLTREADLAAELGWTAEKIANRRRRHRWPHVRLGRFDVRYTDAQIEEIVARYVVAPPKAAPTSMVGLADGLTARGKRRYA